MNRLTPALLMTTVLLSAASFAAIQSGEEPVEEIVAWVNDEIISFSDLRETEQAMISAYLEGKDRGSDTMTAAVDEARSKALTDLITNHLLAQEAEKLYDVKEMRKAFVSDFKERNKIKSDAELEAALKSYQMTKDELERRLLLGSAPDIVIRNQVTRQLGIPEDESKRWYEANLARFTTPAEVTIRDLVLPTNDSANLEARRPLAEKLLGQAQAGGDFEALVRAHSEVPSKETGGLLGPIDPGDLRAEIAAAARTTEIGKVALVSTPEGWHLVKVEARAEAKVKPYDEVKNECEQMCRADKFNTALEKYLAGLWKGSSIEVRQEYATRLDKRYSGQVKLVK